MTSSPSSLKPYQLTLENRNDYLYAYVEGNEDSYEISKEYWTEIADECRRTDARKVMVVENLLENGSMAEIFRLGTELPLMGFDGRKLAFVEAVTEQIKVNQFGELVSINRGLNVKMFSDTGEAEKWLLSTDS